jgi:hypothetical protein
MITSLDSMSKSVIWTLDDDPDVLRALERKKPHYMKRRSEFPSRQGREFGA